MSKRKPPWIKHEDELLTLGNDKIKAIKDRFLLKVTKSRKCWIWNGLTINGGYGKFCAIKYFLSHRISYLLHKGPIGDKWVLHTCDNAKCVNPKHLKLGNHAENMRDMAVRGRCWQKLNPTKIKHIRKMHKDTGSLNEVAAKFGVSKSMVNLIVRKIRWNHVK